MDSHDAMLPCPVPRGPIGRRSGEAESLVGAAARPYDGAMSSERPRAGAPAVAGRED
jgi:hypothetical protein